MILSGDAVGIMEQVRAQHRILPRRTFPSPPHGVYRSYLLIPMMLMYVCLASLQRRLSRNAVNKRVLEVVSACSLGGCSLWGMHVMCTLAIRLINPLTLEEYPVQVGGS